MSRIIIDGEHTINFGTDSEVDLLFEAVRVVLYERLLDGKTTILRVETPDQPIDVDYIVNANTQLVLEYPHSSRHTEFHNFDAAVDSIRTLADQTNIVLVPDLRRNDDD